MREKYGISGKRPAYINYFFVILLSKFLDEKEYNIHQAIVFSNEPRVWQDRGIWYMPIYYIMFLQKSETEQIILPKLEMPTLA